MNDETKMAAAASVREEEDERDLPGVCQALANSILEVLCQAMRLTGQRVPARFRVLVDAMASGEATGVLDLLYGSDLVETVDLERLHLLVAKHVAARLFPDKPLIPEEQHENWTSFVYFEPAAATTTAVMSAEEQDVAVPSFLFTKPVVAVKKAATEDEKKKKRGTLQQQQKERKKKSTDDDVFDANAMEDDYQPEDDKELFVGAGAEFKSKVFGKKK